MDSILFFTNSFLVSTGLLAVLFITILYYLKIQNILLHEKLKELNENQHLSLDQFHELKKQNTELIATNIKLEKSNNKLKSYANIVAHDLRAPLRIMNSFGTILLKKHSSKLDNQARKYLSFISENAKDMHALVENVLNASKFECSRQISKVNLNTVIQKTINIFNEEFKETNAIVEVDKLPIVLGQDTSYQQLFQNLFCNALKFRKKDIPPRIHLRYKENKKSILFSFSDNGIGISEKEQLNIFDTYYTGANKGYKSGFGIGLSTCKDIVESYGGKISVQSTFGKGTTILFTFSKKVCSNPIPNFTFPKFIPQKSEYLVGVA